MTTSTSQVELVLDAHAATGESPTWSEREQALYWIDIEEPALHRLNPATGVDESWETPSQIGAFALCRSGAVIVALRTGVAKMTLEDGRFEPLCAAPYNPLVFRFNEGKCDSVGEILDWREARTAARAMRRITDRAPARFPRSRQSIPGEEPKGNNRQWARLEPRFADMYFADSSLRRIWAYDYDSETGGLSGQRVFAQFEASDGTPDGATVDREGFYWSALYGGGRVLRLAPDGRIDREIRLPVSQPTSAPSAARIMRPFTSPRPPMASRRSRLRAAFSAVFRA